MNLYIGNLPFNLDNQALHDIFSEIGEVTKAIVIMDRETNRSKGFGFVEYANAEDGQRAIEALDGYEINRRNIRVNEAKPREEKPRRSFSRGPRNEY